MITLDRFLCALPRKLGGGHLRGKFVRVFVDQKNMDLPFRESYGYRIYRCPRCGRETRYKVKAIQSGQ